MKKNCWEFHKCSKGPGQGVCPAHIDNRLHGVHDGKNGGRSCWVVAGTMCGGQTQGTFGNKFKNCEQCDFYKEVKQQENVNFQLSINLLQRLKDAPQAGGSSGRPCRTT